MAILRLPSGEVPIDAVGFDVDGVLRDTGWLAIQHCRLAIAELNGIPPEYDDFVHDWSGKLIEYYRACGVICSDEEIRRVNAKYISTHDITEPFHDVEDTLARLESVGVRTFALSGHGDTELQAWFVKHGLHTRFDHVQGGGSDKVSHLIALRQQLSVAPSSACYVGDWGQDMRAADEAGMIPIGLTRGYDTRDGLIKNNARLVIAQLHELTDRIH